MLLHKSELVAFFFFFLTRR